MENFLQRIKVSGEKYGFFTTLSNGFTHIDNSDDFCWVYPLFLLDCLESYYFTQKVVLLRK